MSATPDATTPAPEENDDVSHSNGALGSSPSGARLLHSKDIPTAGLGTPAPAARERVVEKMLQALQELGDWEGVDSVVVRLTREDIAALLGTPPQGSGTLEPGVDDYHEHEERVCRLLDAYKDAILRRERARRPGWEQKDIDPYNRVVTNAWLDLREAARRPPEMRAAATQGSEPDALRKPVTGMHLQTPEIIIVQEELAARIEAIQSYNRTSPFQIKALDLPIWKAELLAVQQGSARVHCDNCGCDWLDSGINPIGCPYCKQESAPDERVILDPPVGPDSFTREEARRAVQEVVRAPGRMPIPACEDCGKGPFGSYFAYMNHDCDAPSST